MNNTMVTFLSFLGVIVLLLSYVGCLLAKSMKLNHYYRVLKCLRSNLLIVAIRMLFVVGIWIQEKTRTSYYTHLYPMPSVNITIYYIYRSGMVNSNMVNSKFHLIRSYYEIFFYHFPNIPCLKCTVNSNFHLIRSKILPTNDFKLTVPDLYYIAV